MRVSFGKFVSAVLLTAAFLLPGGTVGAQPAPVQPSSEEISSFAVTIDVRKEGDILVSERIDYYFPSERHGIYRDIPTRYEFEDGTQVDVPVTVLGVRMGDGSAVPYQVIKNRVGIRLKIGDPNRTISGAHTYHISYGARGALRYFEDHDEIYWNVTGEEWTVPIRRVSATVRLPQEVPAGPDIKVRCFTGPHGSTATDCVAGVQGTTAEFATNVAPFTVAVAWPPGIVAKVEAKGPGLFERAGPFLPLLFPLLVAWFLYMKWHREGRDPEGKGTLVVEYDPPPGLTPAEVGVIVDENAQIKDVSAIIVDLAVRGYLKIREIEKKGLILKDTDYEFERTKDYQNDTTLKPFEVHLLDALFGGSGKVARVSDITRNHTFYDDLPKIQTKLYERLVADGYFPKDPSKVRAAYAGVGIAIIVGLLFLGGPGMMFGGGFLGNSALAVGLTGALILCFAPFMPKKTQKGVTAYEHAFGFREYLDKAERYRLQWQEKEHVFERFLPYAMVFGVADKWSAAFAGMHTQPPSWYEGKAFSAGSFNPALFYGALSSMNSSMSSAMTSRPQQSSGGSGFGSSRGGGGGFSGGGFGGGGGGSW